METNKKARRPVFALLLLAPVALLVLGFDLDRGELKCEQAAAKLVECCPDFEVGRLSCIQQGGCDRESEGTLVAMEESNCIQHASCAELRAFGICERVEYRISALRDPDGPSIQELYEEDWLCEQSSE